MTVNIPNPGTYLAQLGQHIVNLRDAMDDLTDDAAYLAAMGGTAFLEAAPFSLSASDAALIMNTIGTVTPTNATVESINGFLAASVSLTGGS